MFLAGEINNIDYNYDPRYMIDPIRRNQSQATPTSSSHYAPYTLENYPTNTSSRSGGVNLIRQDSYLSAVRSAHQNPQSDFGKINIIACVFLF